MAKGRAQAITLYGEPVLHQPCAPVVDFDRDLARLVEDMRASMRAANGVGLAANQIGVPLRVFVFDVPDANGDKHKGHIVNPVLQPSSSTATVKDTEGCLSVPGPHTELRRAAVATVTGFDVEGRELTVTGDGYLARCLQHECDHLNGIVYVDLLSGRRRRKILAEAGLAGATP
ncbi:peptide deformylase [Dactylosporangium matsuzakiense]|uniref:Peptide deformylase n=1 Tax=Dactylosporangium matsuzakiense TaxID=53360 RepID=A0A9W6KT96_9ACTN|nr:peptide deformylase [Dactylosporangium matsuzakiense]UWZ47995.1 peptide deformylase [Dactylosporangium matsuzakiense]GLL07682.1 peptide deformylase 2 [Dactylosporangium matsuzakiense]